MVGVESLGPWNVSVVEDNIEERSVDFEPAVVFNEAQLSKLVHKVTDPCPSSADHLCQGLLTDPRNHRLALSIFTKMGKQQQDPGQPLLAGVK